MPGVLSSIFDPGEQGSSQNSSETVLDGGTDLAIDQDVGLDLSMTFQDANGGTHSWQSETDIGIHADVGLTVDALLSGEQASDG